MGCDEWERQENWRLRNGKYDKESKERRGEMREMRYQNRLQDKEKYGNFRRKKQGKKIMENEIECPITSIKRSKNTSKKKTRPNLPLPSTLISCFLHSTHTSPYPPLTFWQYFFSLSLSFVCCWSEGRSKKDRGGPSGEVPGNFSDSIWLLTWL